MVDVQFIKSFMRLNGLNADSTATEVRRAFSRARWPDEEVEQALSLIFGNTKQKNSSQSAPVNAGNVRPNYSNSKSNDLSEWLGVDVVVDPHEFRLRQTTKDRFSSALKQIAALFGTILVALAIAAAVGYGLMMYFEVGPFTVPPGTIEQSL